MDEMFCDLIKEKDNRGEGKWEDFLYQAVVHGSYIILL